MNLEYENDCELHETFNVFTVKVTFARISIFGNQQKKLYKSKLYLELSKF